MPRPTICVPIHTITSVVIKISLPFTKETLALFTTMMMEVSLYKSLMMAPYPPMMSLNVKFSIKKFTSLPPMVPIPYLFTTKMMRVRIQNGIMIQSQVMSLMMRNILTAFMMFCYLPLTKMEKLISIILWMMELNLLTMVIAFIAISLMGINYSESTLVETGNT